jgi:hypothetical protein
MLEAHTRVPFFLKQSLPSRLCIGGEGFEEARRIRSDHTFRLQAIGDLAQALFEKT